MRIGTTSILAATLASLLVGAGCDNQERERFSVVVENISHPYEFPTSGFFNTATGTQQPGPIGPGMAYDFEFFAAPGMRLSFATMFVMSNDYFYAPTKGGIALFDDNGQAISGEITLQLLLWDAGTEINQEPGAGPDQPLNQSAANSGAADPINYVRPALDSYGNLPTIDKVLSVSITPKPGNAFVVHIENVSTPTTLPFTGGSSAVILSPGVWVVHGDTNPLFSVGKSDLGQGLESLAEDGAVQTLIKNLDARTGLTSPIAPGVFAVHPSGVQPFFRKGEMVFGNGLEALAEDGAPTQLARALRGNTALTDTGEFSIPVGAIDPAPASSGQHYEFTISAYPGDRLSLATMLVQSNDLFFSFGPEGVPLYNINGEPIAGDFSSALQLWDAGTEVNEVPAAGSNQAPRQAAPDTGIADTAPVGLVQDGFEYPAAQDFLRVRVTLQ
jgi:hypothetical protein